MCVTSSVLLSYKKVQWSIAECQILQKNYIKWHALISMKMELLNWDIPCTSRVCVFFTSLKVCMWMMSSLTNLTNAITNKLPNWWRTGEGMPLFTIWFIKLFYVWLIYRVFTKNWHKIVFAVFTQPVGIASSVQHEQIASSFLCYNIQLLNACGAYIGHSVNLCASTAPQALADFSCDVNHLPIHLIPFLGDQLSLFSASKTSTYTGVLNRP